MPFSVGQLECVNHPEWGPNLEIKTQGVISFTPEMDVSQLYPYLALLLIHLLCISPLDHCLSKISLLFLCLTTRQPRRYVSLVEVSLFPYGNVLPPTVVIIIFFYLTDHSYL